MAFRITGLDPKPFRPSFGLPDEALRQRGVLRTTADASGGYPDRIELRDAAPGESVLLLNFTHQPAATPYRASHAIYVREGAAAAFDAIDAVPDMLRRRLISLRAFNGEHMMVAADVVEGTALRPLIDRLIDDPTIAYLHAHFAKFGCYAARIARA